MTTSDIAALVRERLAEAIPSPSPRKEIIRELPEPARFNLVHIITGMRRCGKTFYLFQLMQSLLAKGVDRQHMFYFVFSDERLKPLDRGIMQTVVEEYWRQVPDARECGCYLFLDEVQEMPEWEHVINSLMVDFDVDIYATGSNSRLLASEISTYLTGRYVSIPVYPLSFEEFL